MEVVGLDFLGPMSTFFVQVGSRQMNLSFTDAQKRMFQLPLVQVFIMFFIFFSSTKKLTLAVLLTSLYYLTLNVLFNDKHPLNVIPRFWLRKEGFLEEEKDRSVPSYKKAMNAIYPS